MKISIIAFVLILSVYGCNSETEKIADCSQAIEFHNGLTTEANSTSQFIKDEIYRNFDGVHFNFTKLNQDTIYADLRIEWTSIEFRDTAKIDNVSFDAAHIYIEFSGGATSHISCTYVRSYNQPHGFHIMYNSIPIRSEILDQIEKLKIKKISIATTGYSVSTDDSVVCSNISTSLSCLRKYNKNQTK
jgi:hypothetical protein